MVHKAFYMNVYETVSRAGSVVWPDFSVFLVLFVVLMLLSKYLPGRPWIVLIAIIGVIYGFCMATYSEDLKPKLLRDLYPEMKEATLDKAVLWQFLYWKSMFPEDPKKLGIPVSEILLGSLKVAFVAVLETLISARIADTATGTRHNSSPECGGMGLANVVCGALGGTPCTGVLVRTSVNVSSGATHKTS